MPPIASTPLISRSVDDIADVRAFFDAMAADYRDIHGPSDRWLRQRLDILRDLLPAPRGGLIVEIGCGTAMHLVALADRYDRAVGLDLSPAMIERCEAVRHHHPLRDRLRFAVDPAERLHTLGDDTVDALICVGAFEHLLDQPRAAAQIGRVLKPGGTFACLTPNGAYLWYTRIAPLLGLATQHLSTDRFLSESQWRELLGRAGLQVPVVRYWSFIPRGDMPRPAAMLLDALDGVGRLPGLNRLRGGLALRAIKPLPRL